MQGWTVGASGGGASSLKQGILHSFPIFGLPMNRNRNICADGGISQGRAKEGGIRLAGSQKPLP